MLNDYRERARYLREQQLMGRTREQALAMWDASVEIAETFARDRLRADDLSDGEIKDAVEDWKAIKELGL